MAKKTFTGKVVSTKMQKTVVVEITRRIAHPVYKKYIKVSSKIKADTNNFQIAEGDTVVLESTKPISRTKNFVVTHKVEDEKVVLVAKTPKTKAKKGGAKASK